MHKIAGGGGAILPDRINSLNSTESIHETTGAETTGAETTAKIETASSTAPTESKRSADKRALTEHKIMGNLQQMRLNSMLNLQPKRGIDSSSANTNNGAIVAGDFNYEERAGLNSEKTSPISYQNPDTDTRKAWTFQDAYPVKWQGPDFDASKNEIAIESLEIAHEGFIPGGKPSTPGGIEYPNLTIYVPEQNETLQSIASKFGITEEALAKANNLTPRNPLPPGIQLKIVPEK